MKTGFRDFAKATPSDAKLTAVVQLRLLFASVLIGLQERAKCSDGIAINVLYFDWFRFIHC